jgi:hypothetical protein
MTDRMQVEPGSPSPLTLFHAWCRGGVALSLSRDSAPLLLFADGPNLEEPLVDSWELEGERPEEAGFLTDLIERWMAETEASQIGISIPFRGETDGILLISVGETGHVAEQTALGLDGFPERWRTMPRGGLPFARWQALLATNAGYRQFTKWRCRTCESVCPGEADEIPSPCDFCGFEEIEAVPIETPLAPPQPPYDDDYVSEQAELLESPLALTVLGLLAGPVPG